MMKRLICLGICAALAAPILPAQVKDPAAAQEEAAGDAAALLYGDLPETRSSSVTWEKFNMYPPALPQLGQLVPKPADGSGRSLWSVGCETLDRDYADFDQFKAFFRGLGVGYARVQTGWEKTETEKGTYDFAWLDHIVDGLLEEGVIPWLSLSYGNKLYGSTRSRIESMCSKENLKAWNAYVEAIVRHYKGKVTYWEVWNEPNLKDKDVKWFGTLLAQTVKSVKKADPEARIIAFGTAGVDYKYVDKTFRYIADSKIMNAIDYVSVHTYYPNPDDVVRDYASMRAVIKFYNPAMEIIQGESGCPSQLEYTHAMARREWTEYKQAKWDARRFTCDFTQGVPSSVFTMVDLNYGNMLQSFGLIRMNLRSVPQYIRPAYYAIRNLCTVLTPDVKPLTEGVSWTSSSTRDLQVTPLEKSGKVFGYIIYFKDDVPTDTMEREKITLTIEGIEPARDLVYVDAITGKVYDALPFIHRGGRNDRYMKFTGIPVWDAPVLVLDRKMLEIR